MSNAIRIFLAIIYGIKAATLTYMVSVLVEDRVIWPVVILMFTSGAVITLMATSPGRGR
jgi:hypothetical protein